MLRMIPRQPRRVGTSQLQQQLVAAGYPVTIRTVQRDLNGLACFFPLYCDDEKIAGWSWPKDAFIDIPGMEPHTALTFYLAERFLKQMLPSSCVAFLEPQFKQSHNYIENSTTGMLGHWPDKIQTYSRHLQLQSPTISPEILSHVYDSVLYAKQLEITYQKRGGENQHQYLVNPLGLVFVDQIVYLVCTFSGYQDIRHIALHRISLAQIKEIQIQENDGFRLQEYVATGVFGVLRSEKHIKIKLLFDPVVAIHLQETPLSSDQSWSEQSDKRIMVEANVQDTDQLRWWLLGFGDLVEVLEPEPLRIEIGKTLRNAAAVYKEIQ